MLYYRQLYKMSDIYNLININNIPYRYIWIYINEKDSKKEPIGEMNNKKLEDIRNDNNENILNKKPEVSYINKKIHKLTDNEYNSLFLCYSLYIKYVENLYCIDIDDDKINSIYELNKITEVFKNCLWVKGNTKGIHIYVYIKDMPKYSNQQKVFKKFNGDLIKKNNMWERLDKKINYNQNNELITNLKFDDIKELLNEKFYGRKIRKINIDKESILNLCEIKGIKDINILDTNEEKISEQNIKIEEYLELLQGIGTKGHTYSTWLKIVSWCVSYMNKNDFLNWIENDWRDKASNMWDNFIKNRKIPIYLLETIGKEFNPDFYRNWRTKYKKYLKLKIIEKGSNDVAEFIKDKLQMILVYSKDDKWIGCDKNTNLWRELKRPDEMIISHIQREIEEARESLLVVKNRIEDEEIKKKMEKMEKEYIKHRKDVSNPSYCAQIIKFLSSYLYDSDFTEKLDNYKYKIPFRNGILDLTTLEFREGIRNNDYLTDTVPMNFEIPKNEEVNWVRYQLKKINNYNDNHLDYYLSSLGYAMTGDSKKEQLFWYFLGQTAENGKSIIFEILEVLMPNLVQKGTSNMLDKGIDLKKEVPTWKGKLLIWMNEVSSRIKDEDLVKALCDGTDYKYNKNYSVKAEKIPIQFKLFCVSNNSLTIKGDAGISRRLQVCHFESQFKENYEDNYEKLQFKKDKDFYNKLCNEYKHALLWLIFKYSKLYYDEKKLKPYPDEWKKHGDEIIEDNNKFQQWFYDNFEIEKDLKISKHDFEEGMPIEFKNIKIKDELLRMKVQFEYDKNLKKKGNRGVYKGFDRILES